MKRCPECHFTFEDYEERCDFDGSELTQFPESSGPKLAPPLPFYVRMLKSPYGLAALAMVGLVLSSLVIGYFDSSSPESAEKTKQSSEVSQVTPPPSRTHGARRRKANIQSRRLRSTRNLRLKFMAARSRRVHHVRTATAKAAPTRRNQRTAEARSPRPPHATSGHAVAIQNVPKKHDSKVTAFFKKSGSVLKKTVGFLKRPFDL
jgi:hypothetical protein